jgi:hypothetical protein
VVKMASQGLSALLSGHGRVDQPDAQAVLESLARTGPHVGRSGLELSPRPMRGSPRAREIFHECRGGFWLHSGRHRDAFDRQKCNLHRRIATVCCPELGEFIQ